MEPVEAVGTVGWLKRAAEGAPIGRCRISGPGRAHLLLLLLLLLAPPLFAPSRNPGAPIVFQSALATNTRQVVAGATRLGSQAAPDGLPGGPRRAGCESFLDAADRD